MESHDEIFDNIMERAGDDGRFQSRFNYIFNVGMVICASLTYMNVILALNVPDHWCYVPGREQTNYTVEQWKEITLPRESNARGIINFSKCKMYSFDRTTIQPWDYTNRNFTESRSAVDCDVHEFDKNWYESTIVSQEDWVCSNDLQQTNAFVFNRIGEVLGALIFGQLGDTLGRKIIYYISVFLIVGGRVMTIFTTWHYILFAMASIIGNLSAFTIFQSPYIIAMEIAKPDNRANVAMIQSLSWTVGSSVLPLFYWWLRDWVRFFWISTLPLLIFLFFPRYMIESPRWLANRGRLEEAAMYLNRIAVINGKELNMSEKELQSLLPAKETEKVYGVFSLFSGLRLAKNTLILITCWVICTLAYFTLILYIVQMAGNPFLNFLIQSASEAPAYLIGNYLGNSIGRRLTNILSFVLAAVFCIPTIFLVQNDEWQLTTTCMMMIIKCWSSITFFAINLQAMESYPTCLRQTGISIGVIVSNMFGMIGPYIAYLGTAYDSRYPICILMALFTFGGSCSLFLPETLHQKLPDSLEEARFFGANQEFWSLPKAPKKFENEKENERY